MRKYAREVAFSLVFEYMFTKAFNEMELEQFDKNNLTDEDFDFIKKLYKGVVGEYSDLENRVGELSKGFKIDRVFKVDKAVLMMAIFELDNLDTPKSVVINEAVELAKKFSTEFSANFVNEICTYIKHYRSVGHHIGSYKPRSARTGYDYIRFEALLF